MKKWAFGEMGADMRRGLAEYELDHQTRGNQLCHAVGIPLLMFGVIGLTMCGLGSTNRYAPGIALLAVVYLGYKALRLVRFGGMQGWAVVLLAVLMEAVGDIMGASPLLKTSAICIAVGLVLQVPIGHWYFEGNRPSFTKSVPQALEAAPLHIMAAVFGMFRMKK